MHKLVHGDQSTAVHALKDINLSVKKGERIVIVRAFRIRQKVTMIRCINRFGEEHQKGSIVVNGIELTHDLRYIDADSP